MLDVLGSASARLCMAAGKCDKEGADDAAAIVLDDDNNGEV